jgi:hypothetical protein
MNAFLIELQDQPGELARLAEAISSKGINIESITGATSGGSGSVAVLTNDEEGTRRALDEAGLSCRELEIVTTTLEHKPGTLAAATRKLADAGINIAAILPTKMAEGTVGLAIATDQPARAREILGSPAGTGVGVG